MTNDIHVVLFANVHDAENMLENVNTWEQKGWLKLHDAVVVTRGAGSEESSTPIATANSERPMLIPGTTGGTELQIKQTQKRGGKYVLGGGGIGLLAGMLLGGPIGGLVVGAALGGLTGALRDYGIDDGFIKSLSEGLRPGTSALFLMTSESDPEKILPELRPYKANLVSTTLPPERARALRKALAEDE